MESADFFYMYACARDLQSILADCPFRRYVKDDKIVFKNHVHAVADVSSL